jgi:hypothetical protein
LPIKPTQNTNRFEALVTLDDDESNNSDKIKPAASTDSFPQKAKANLALNEKGVTFSTQTSSHPFNTTISTKNLTKYTPTINKGIL